MAASDRIHPRLARASRARRWALRALLVACCGVAFATEVAAQQKVWRIGFLASGSSSTPNLDGFRQGMQELGLVEGRNYVIQGRFAEGRYDRLQGLASELVRANVDVIVAGTTPSVQAARQASASIPVVMVAVPDPVGEGFATSLSRPGGNITGLSNIGTEVSSKHVELLQAVLPRLSRVAVLINPLNPSDALILEQVQGVAYGRGMKVTPVEASTATQIEAGLAAMARDRVEGLIVAADSYIDAQRDQIAKLALKARLPVISSARELTEAGGLMSYGQDLAGHYRRAATYVDKIMKGAKPGSLPIEQPTVLQLVINQRSARALGLVLPRELLLRADKVIE
jgi:putative ABC transport system substrate-binding protein